MSEYRIGKATDPVFRMSRPAHFLSGRLTNPQFDDVPTTIGTDNRHPFLKSHGGRQLSVTVSRLPTEQLAPIAEKNRGEAKRTSLRANTYTAY